LASTSGDLQAGTVGAELPEPLAVRLTDASGKPVAGRDITFRVMDGGGSVPTAAIQTDAAGSARVKWVLGPVAGDTQRVEARLAPGAGQAALTVVFRAVGVPAAPFAVKTIGNGQTAGYGAPLPTAIGVQVLDSLGNGIPDAPVAWRVISGGGSLAAAAPRTDSKGIATATFTLGTVTAEPQRVEVTTPAGSATLDATPDFTSAVLELADPLPASVAEDAPDSVMLRLRLRLASGAPLAGVPVTITTLPIPSAASPSAPVTGADGIATARWSIRTIVATYSAVAEVGPQRLSLALARTGSPSVLSIDSPPGRVLRGSDLSFTVTVLTALGTPVSGVLLQSGYVFGGGSPASDTARTDFLGRATIHATAGSTRGSQRMTLDAEGLSTTLVEFTPYESPAFVTDYPASGTPQGAAWTPSITGYNDVGSITAFFGPREAAAHVTGPAPSGSTWAASVDLSGLAPGKYYCGLRVTELDGTTSVRLFTGPAGVYQPWCIKG
jgi:hypothetical protein